MNENNVKTEQNPEMTVGEILRNARTTGRRKREIQTIAKQLCIREEFLQALEDGNYKAIPETVYILGFARNYAMELGLDPDDIVNQLKREMGLTAACNTDDDNENNDDKVCDLSDSGEKWYKHIFSRSLKYVRRHWVWFLIGLVIVAVLVFGAIMSMPRGNNLLPDTPTVTNVPVADVADNTQYNVAVRERFGTENAETARVVLQATQESWVKVEDRGGDTVFSRVLVAGDVYYVPSGDGYSATFGNAGGVDIWVDGTQAPKQGADHTRVSGISLNPSSLMSVESDAE